MKNLYCVKCREDVPVNQIIEYSGFCSVCNERTLGVPLKYLRKQSTSLRIQEELNVFAQDLIKNLELFIDGNSRKSFFSRSTDAYIRFLREGAFYLGKDLGSSVRRVGELDSFGGMWSDPTLDLIDKIERIPRLIQKDYLKPEKVMSRISFYPNLSLIAEFRSIYMIATYGEQYLPKGFLGWV